ncbi:MAG: hypothetical protein PHD15_02595 [Clostridia bacterium]|nr:hypothetical protein [Clostridia bacterium]MDD4386636.1 hypothetical protein [Clostridia bacterium]
MSISKISRGLVVAIFTVLIILLIFTNIYLSFSDLNLNNGMIGKIIYVIGLLSLITIYALLKEKLSKKKIKKSISLTYRFVFLITATFLVKIIYIYTAINDISKFTILTWAIISVLSAVVLKKIIYNISKSDLLSVVGMLTYALLPNMIIDKLIYYNMVCLTLFSLLVIMYMQKLIDELKQLGIKTKKYIVLSLFTGIFIGITMIFNLNSLIWIVVALSMIFVTSNIDKTNLNFSNKIINNLRQKNKVMLYSIERIYINKIFVSVIIILASSYLSYILLNFVILKSSNIPSTINVISNIKNPDGNNAIENVMLFKTIEKNNIISNFENFVDNSKGYYLILCIYILFIEILTVFLRRRYDTKSTIIKILFIVMITFYTLFGLNILVYGEILTVLLILISVINTSNLYLNRDERIKLLNS